VRIDLRIGLRIGPTNLILRHPGTFFWSGLGLEARDSGEAGGAGSMLDISLVGTLFLHFRGFPTGFLHGMSSKEASGGNGFFHLFAAASCSRISVFPAFLGSMHLPSEGKCQI